MNGVAFDVWTNRRQVDSYGTDHTSDRLPVQRWYRFKESFTPELAARAISESAIPISRCLDPFGGSGTTALACQFLGVMPVTLEVNPFLADLIRAKLDVYDADAVVQDFDLVIKRAAQCRAKSQSPVMPGLPPTFIEPGVNGRWIFDVAVARHIAALLAAIDGLDTAQHRRLLRVLLGSVLIPVSNVTINGKSRRYRSPAHQQRDPFDVDRGFMDAVYAAVFDLHDYGRRSCRRYELHQRDSRTGIRELAQVELAVFSPPYPNSWDYTDIYNVELWTLGYLTSKEDNRALRTATLCSHVQLDREYPPAPAGSPALTATLARLIDQRKSLWNRRIPEMVGGYFADICAVLDSIHAIMAPDGAVWMVLGDSCYSGVTIDVPGIVAELLSAGGDWRIRTVEKCRSLRSSAQQGGRFSLSETLLVIEKPEGSNSGPYQQP